MLVFWTALACAQQRVTADEVKAAFLYNFTAFVEWPPDSKRDHTLIIAVAGAPEVAEELRQVVASRKTQERRVSVVQVAVPEQLGRAQMLYVGASESRRLERWIAAAAQRPVLVVSDVPDALERGSMINFVTTDRVQFEVALEAAIAAGLRLSSRLLSVAMRVKKGERDPGRALALSSDRKWFSGCCRWFPARRVS